MSLREEDAVVEEWQNRVNQDLVSLKSDQSHIKSEQQSMKDAIRDLQINDRLQDQEIKSLKETVYEIKDDTNWIRRKITGAIITASITAVVGGIIAIAIAKLF